MKRVLLVLLLLIVALPALVLTWVAATPGGARFAAQEIQRWLPGLRIGAVEGSLASPLELRQLSFENDGVRVEIDRARLHWSPRALLLWRLRIVALELGQVDVWVKDRPPDEQQSNPVYELPLGLRIQRATVQRLRVQLPGEQPPLVFEAIELDARWIGRRLQLRRLAARVPEAGLLQAEGEARLVPDRVHIDRLLLQGPGEARLSGEYIYAGRFDLKLGWKDLRWPLQGVPQYRSPQGEAGVSGGFDGYRYRLQTRLAEARAAVDLQAEGEGSTQGLRVQRLEAVGLGGRLDAQANLQWSPQLQIEADGTLKNIHPEQLLPELAGVINGRFKVRTQQVAEQPQIDFEAELFDSVWREHKLSLSARGRYADDGLTLARAELRSAGSRLTAQGRVWPTLDARAELNSPNLSPLWPGLGGRLQAKLTAQGPVEGPRIKGHIDAQQLRYQAFSLATLKLQADVDLRGRTTLQLRIGDAVAGTKISSASLDIDGSIRRHDIRLTAKTAEGDVELALRGGADIARRAWRGELASGRLAPAQLAAWTLETPAALQVSASDLSLQPACWKSAPARACLRLLRNAGLQRLAFRLEDFHFAYLQPFLPEGWDIEGRIGGDGEIDLTPAGQIARLRADLATSAGRWSVNQRKLAEFQPGVIRAGQDNGHMHLLVDLPFAQGIARLDAQLGAGALLMQRPLSGELKIELPELTWLRLFTTEVTSVEGSIGGQFKLAGTLARPLARGELALRGGKLRLATPGIEVSGIQGSLRGGSDGVLDLDLVGYSGGGELRVAGKIDPRVDPIDADISIQGDNFQAARLPSARIWVSPDLKLAFHKRTLEVSGEVRVPKAEITPADFASGTGPSSDQIIIGRDGRPPESRGLLKLDANVRLKLGEQVSFKGYGLTTQLAGGLTVSEQSGRQTRAAGEINLVGGRYKAYGQDLRIVTGKLIYTGGFITEPALELKAERQPTENVTVGVTVRGTLAKPQFSQYSSPSMTQQQQLSWLILGRSMEEGGNTEGDRAVLANAALALGLSGGDFLAQRLRSSIGLDEISIASKPGESSDQARLTIGKYLSPKLYVSYGIGIFQPGNIFKLVYDLGRGFKLQTESGVEAGGDLLYTIER